VPADNAYEVAQSIAKLCLRDHIESAGRWVCVRSGTAGAEAVIDYTYDDPEEAADALPLRNGVVMMEFSEDAERFRLISDASEIETPRLEAMKSVLKRFGITDEQLAPCCSKLLSVVAEYE